MSDEIKGWLGFATILLFAWINPMIDIFIMVGVVAIIWAQHRQ